MKRCAFVVPGHTLSFMSQCPGPLPERTHTSLALDAALRLLVVGWMLFLHEKYY